MNNERNQNNIQHQQKQKMTPEELERTHVLNLNALQETIKYEKMTSKKPSLILAIIGVIAILLGTTFQIAENISLKQKEERKIEQRRLEKKKVPKTATEYLNCKLYVPNNPDGTDCLMEISYGMSNQKLMEFTKKFTIVVTPGSTIGANTVASYVNAYKAFMNPIDGYQIMVTPNSTIGLVVLVKADYNTLDLTKLSPQQATHFSTSVDYLKDTSINDIKEDMLKKGYTCE
ncbi:MAG: hypothetical protein IKE70_06280 [Bacilli bacterium]|nr:hypothetical protein [Bacilli bacterium]